MTSKETATPKAKLIKLHNYRGKMLQKQAINPESGNRCKKDSNGDVALQITLKMTKAGKSLQEIKDVLNSYTKKNGKERNLDAGYLSYLVCSHSDYIRLWTDRVEIIQEFPKPVKTKKAVQKD